MGDTTRKAVKRKRAVPAMTKEEMGLRIGALEEEMRGLFGYFKEMTVGLSDLEESASAGGGGGGGWLNGAVAVLLEESEASLSRLVDEIYKKLKGREGVSVGAVKTAVLFVGQRVMYGVPNLDADVLEDESQACLWCWESRDLKLLPKSARGVLKIRRTCRKKIHERITAVSTMLTALKKAESDSIFTDDLVKVSEKLGKVLTEADIRLLMDSMLKKNGTEIDEKDAKREEKLLTKQLERNKREAEKEKKRMDRELQKEKLQSEKERKRLQEEAEKDEKRRDKGESEMRKQLRKQQEEAEKDQRRRQKEEAELKKQLAIQKQASIMERFLKKCKSMSGLNDQSSSRVTTSDSKKESERVPEAVTQSMDCALASSNEFGIEDLRKLHLSSWRNLGHSVRSNPNQHWGIRKKPKTELFKELKLGNNKDIARAYELSLETLDGRSSVDGVTSSPEVKKCKWSKKLLQFDKSHRPAFYGIWPKKSLVVGPRRPFRKDPDLDYDIDSDEEWEEEDPGESLSDCDKDDEEDRLEEGSLKADDEEDSEDGFFVPDGYLSEDEGVEVDRMEVDVTDGEKKCSADCKQELESVELSSLLRQQKHLHNLTEHALRKNQPLIILNLTHEKITLLTAENLSGASKMEQTCLQALSIRAFHNDLLIEISIDGMKDEDKEACQSNSRGSTTPVPTASITLDSDLPTIVSVIQASTLGINRVVDSLQQKFPTVPRSQLRNKVREISDFSPTDNHWKVKKDVLTKLGLPVPVPPDRITSFFSKRCLPPDGKSFNPNETSPLSPKPGSAVWDQRGCTYNQQ